MINFFKNFCHDCPEKRQATWTRIWAVTVQLAILLAIGTFAHIIVDIYDTKQSQVAVHQEKIKLLEEQVELLKIVIEKEHGKRF